ncbi:hypothetical protein [Pontibacter oryzae]|uniref:Uncharacterized protein n=1 Tax=Pontibacter oryzae TaxID=2304593 RepID=A0A399SBK5_9BACT|nr:hypothetical protein [Pontibacter oryzae]RIJ41436.1 hypothetical protein D1627_05175 [Pontibacter oryzae]
MKLKNFTLALLCGGVGLLTVSCDKEDAAALVEPQASFDTLSVNNATAGHGNLSLDASALAANTFSCSYDTFSKALAATYSSNAVNPSTCGPTPFNSAISPYARQFSAQDWEWYDLMSTLAQLYTYLDDSKQYFGADGKLTNFAAKHKRNLESFWDMKDEITLNGQHTSSLQNRDAIAAVYVNFAGLTPAQAFANADFIIANIIQPSTAFKTTPLLSFDGFATSGDLIVVGDGIVQVMTDAGVDEQVTFAGILAHEWGHQVQFNNYERWYGPRQNTPEATRKTELEADVFSSYYMTHKRGATYNWKRAAEFFELFYNIGDCSFTSSGHHGTPNQRLAASRLGWIIAQETKPMGHILSADDLHSIFMAALNDIIENKIDSSAAMASLKNSQLKAVYGNVLNHKQEIQAIMSGQVDAKNL